MTDYVRIPIRADEHQRLTQLQHTLSGKIDSYLSRPSLSDVIKYLLDQQETQTMTTQANSAHSICTYCGTIYNSAHGQHICRESDLETLIDQEQNMTDEPDQRAIAKLHDRITEVKEFWKTHPEHQSEVSRHMPT